MNEEIITYDTRNDGWKLRKTKGEINPTPRIYHSVTLCKREKENVYIMHTVIFHIVTHLLIHLYI